MPYHHFPEDIFARRLNHITMARNDPIKVPGIYSPYTAGEGITIAPAGYMPDETLLQSCRALGILKSAKKLGKQAGGGGFTGLGVLLGSWKVEYKVSLDQSSLGFVAEDELLVEVAVDIFIIEFGIEFRTNLQSALVLG